MHKKLMLKNFHGLCHVVITHYAYEDSLITWENAYTMLSKKISKTPKQHCKSQIECDLNNAKKKIIKKIRK